MKLKLLKDHVLGKADDVVEVTDELGNYLARCNVGVEYTEEVKPKKVKKK